MWLRALGLVLGLGFRILIFYYIFGLAPGWRNSNSVSVLLHAILPVPVAGGRINEFLVGSDRRVCLARTFGMEEVREKVLVLSEHVCCGPLSDR